MATNKTKSRKKVATKAKAGATSKAPSARKKTAKKVATKAKGLLGKIAQRSAQLILDSGLLGEVPERASKRAVAKKRRTKA